jgi:virginiamycin A acetyltransferase
VPPPDPDRLYPAVYGPNHGRAQGWPVVFLRPLVESPFTEVGEYTYYADPVDPTGFERNNVLFHYGPGRLVIGRYCALARDVRFLMGAAGHDTAALSTYPFPMFGGDWLTDMAAFAGRPLRGDVVVGNDVWLGYRATVLPGVRIGDGAVVAAGAMVGSDVPPYGVVAGNPARLVRHRFGPEDVRRLLAVAWWSWPVEHVTRHVGALMASDIGALEDAAAQLAADRPAPGPGASEPPVPVAAGPDREQPQ